MSDESVPPLGSPIRWLKSSFQRHLPPRGYAVVASVYYAILPHKSTRLIWPRQDSWFVWTPDGTYHTTDRRNTHRGSGRVIDIKFDKYQSAGFVEVEPSDTVVDVGAYVGEFTRAAADIAQRVIALEADPHTYPALERNTVAIENVETALVALADDTVESEFLAASNPTESSLVDVDKGDFETVELETVRLDEFLQRQDVDKVDFLKIDAEGMEPEVLAGTTDIEVEKVAVDAGPERFNESPMEAVRSYLEDRGYAVRTSDSMVYGRKA